MPTSIDTHLLVIAAVVALVAWRLYSRIRRMIGRQRLSRVRPWFTVVAFPLLLVLLLATAGAMHPMAGVALLAGVALGTGLGVFGLRLTRFEATPAGLFYTPNAHLGIALSLLFILRLGYRIGLPLVTGRLPDPQSAQLGSSPLTLAIFGMLAGYYVSYAIGLLRWRARVSALPVEQPDEH